MSKQTAVQWLIEQYEQKIGKGITKVMFDEIEQAKQMEKEQIIKAYDESNKRLCLQCTDFKTGIKYYNETYKNETK